MRNGGHGRDFSAGRVVGRTCRVLFRQAPSLAVVGVAASLLGFGLETGVDRLCGAVLGTGRMAATLADVLDAVVSLVTGGVASGAIALLALPSLDGRRAGLRLACATGLRLAVPLGAITGAMYAGIFACSLWLKLAMSGMAAPDGELSGTEFPSGLGLLAASLALYLPAFVPMVLWCAAVPVRVMEGPGIRAALARSFSLTSGYRVRLFGLAMATVVLLLIALTASSVVAANSSFQATASVMAQTGITQVLIGAVNVAVAGVACAVCYAELRGAKDGAPPGELAAVFA